GQAEAAYVLRCCRLPVVDALGLVQQTRRCGLRGVGVVERLTIGRVDAGPRVEEVLLVVVSFRTPERGVHVGRAQLCDPVVLRGDVEVGAEVEALPAQQARGHRKLPAPEIGRAA